MSRIPPNLVKKITRTFISGMYCTLKLFSCGRVVACGPLSVQLQLPQLRLMIGAISIITAVVSVSGDRWPRVRLSVVFVLQDVSQADRCSKPHNSFPFSGKMWENAFIITTTISQTTKRIAYSLIMTFFKASTPTAVFCGNINDEH